MNYSLMLAFIKSIEAQPPETWTNSASVNIHNPMSELVPLEDNPKKFCKSCKVLYGMYDLKFKGYIPDKARFDDALGVTGQNMREMYQLNDSSESPEEATEKITRYLIDLYNKIDAENFNETRKLREED